MAWKPLRHLVLAMPNRYSSQDRSPPADEDSGGPEPASDGHHAAGGERMFSGIFPYVVRYANVIATVTGIDVEVVDADLMRVAGTGMYADKVGAGIHDAGEVYRHVLRTREAVFMDNPREHALCRACASRATCQELLSLCTPIVHDGTVLGVIGLVCFTDAERRRVLAQRTVFQDFVLQIADAIANEVAKEQKQRRTRQWLDMLMQIVDGNNRGIMVLDSGGGVSYINETARQELGLPEDPPLGDIGLIRTGDAISGVEEFTVETPGGSAESRETHVILGQTYPLDSRDPAFHQALVFDSLPRFTQMLSLAAAPQETTGGLSAIIGESPAVRRLKSKVCQIARTSSTVLITGESGTGKEMFARAIHAESARHDKPFIAVNCGAIPDALLESELFGYVRGAFTGASPSGRMGKFELAHQGVLFLDEIGSMPLYLQVKLLRVLQDKRIIRLGSNRLVEVDVRIIAATNDNLQSLIEQRMFRDDLYYRLNVIPLEIPPLRMRREDIPALAEYFMARYCGLFGKKPTRFSAQVLEMLKAYFWPGNVREFENIVEYLANIIPDGGSVTAAMLPEKIRREGAEAPAAREHGAVAGRHSFALPASGADNDGGHPLLPALPLHDLERLAIEQALKRFGVTAEGKRRAAESLGIGVATLYRKLKE